MTTRQTPDAWLPLKALPIGDQRFIVRKFRGTAGQIAQAYWSGSQYLLAPVSDDATPLDFRPIEYSALSVEGEPGVTISQTPDAVREALGKIERAYREWDPDASFASTVLASVSTIAREALAALDSRAGEAGEGWKLVPVEPTDAMWEAFDHYNGDKRTGYDTWLKAWSAMLAASPAPAVHAVPAGEVERLREALSEAVAVLERLPYGDWPGKMYSGKTVAANALIRRARAALSHGEWR